MVNTSIYDVSSKFTTVVNSNFFSLQKEKKAVIYRNNRNIIGSFGDLGTDDEYCTQKEMKKTSKPDLLYRFRKTSNKRRIL